MKRRLSEEEARRIRKSGLDLSDKHLQLRVLTRIDLHKVKARRFDINVLKTVGVTRSKRKRWD